MSQIEKLQLRLLSGVADKNFPFADLCKLLDLWGFDCRINVSHHIYHRKDVEEIINIQPKGSLAKHIRYDRLEI
jgi:hypothetical protein